MKANDDPTHRGRDYLHVITAGVVLLIIAIGAVMWMQRDQDTVTVYHKLRDPVVQSYTTERATR